MTRSMERDLLHGTSEPRGGYTGDNLLPKEGAHLVVKIIDRDGPCAKRSCPPPAEHSRSTAQCSGARWRRADCRTQWWEPGKGKYEENWCRQKMSIFRCVPISGRLVGCRIHPWCWKRVIFASDLLYVVWPGKQTWKSRWHSRSDLKRSPWTRFSDRGSSWK